MRLTPCLAAAALISCGEASLDSTTPGGELASAQAGLTVRLKEKLGPAARLEQIFGRGDEVLLGVALEDSVEESDVRAPLALASWKKSTDSLDVVDAQPAYLEAAKIGGALATVSADGALKVGDRMISTSVKGELLAAPNGALLFTQEAVLADPGESAVVLAAADGSATMVADGEGVDDRPAVSPDGTTVVFVSGRSGIASLWRTTVSGEAPVQLTNAGIEPGLEREGEAEPEGFVPPPVTADAVVWMNADEVRYDAGGGELWKVNVRTGAATRLEGGQP